MHAAERRLLRLLGLAIFFEGYGRSLLAIVLPYVGQDLHADPGALSYALALVGIGSFGVLLLGPLADRFGRRRLLLASILLFSLLGTGTATAPTLVAVVVWQASARVFQEGALFSAAVITAEERPARLRGTAHGVIGMVNAGGAGFAGLVLATIAYSPGGWRGLCFISLLPIVFLPFLRGALPESRRWLSRTDH